MSNGVSDIEIIKKHHEHTLDKQDKIVVDRNVSRVVTTTRNLSDGRAKLGDVGSLEILFKLGRFLKEKEDK